MSKSTGNNILPKELISGKNKLFKNGYSPNVIRFFFLQAHYRNVLDLSENALKASEKGYNKIVEAAEKLKDLKENRSSESDFDIQNWIDNCYKCMNDDFNTPLGLSIFFNMIKHINSLAAEEKVTKDMSEKALPVLEYMLDVLGLKIQTVSDEEIKLVFGLINKRERLREEKQFDAADKIRDEIASMGISLIDHKSRTLWMKKEAIKAEKEN